MENDYTKLWVTQNQNKKNLLTYIFAYIPYIPSAEFLIF